VSGDYGVSERRLPWLLRLVFRLALDGVDQEREALRNLGAPDIDAFIEFDEVLALTYAEKKVERTARYLMGEKVDPMGVEYEFAYLRRRIPIRSRLEKRSMEQLFMDISGGEGGEAGGE